MALVIAGDRSSAGKTTVTLALLAYLKQQQLKVQSFKVGPDYIDPMFHDVITGKSCRNLDPILTSEAYVKTCFINNTQDVDFALIEGVMGLFDGIPNRDFNLPIASTAHIASLLNLQILLVIDCSRLSGSIAAIVHGFTTLNPRLKFAGCVLNRVGSDRHLELLQLALEPLNFPVLGVLNRQAEIEIPDRHLGLVPTDELSNFHIVLDRLETLARQCFNWPQLLPLLKVEHSKLAKNPSQPLVFSQTSAMNSSIKIGIAKDKSFNFYYVDNLELLQSLGAELIFWSPLEDLNIPQNLQGLYFGGGFPEVFAEHLSQNSSVHQSIHRAIQLGIPTYAECGGLMYLSQAIRDFNHHSWPMIGTLPTTAVMGEQLKLGYFQGTVLHDSLLLKRGDQVCGHQFHRSDLTVQSHQPLFELKRYNQRNINEVEGWRSPLNIHASYLHLHWGNCLEIPTRFIQQCQEFFNANLRFSSR
ncbi:MAG: cobyrinate a,c-diamide synthase [Microcoleaceae cyanobacterium]